MLSKFSSSTALRTFLITLTLWIFFAIYIAFYSFGSDYKNGATNCQSLVETARTLRNRLDEGSIKMEKLLEQLNYERDATYRNNQEIVVPVLGVGHELLRRRAIHYTRELWYTLSSDLQKLDSHMTSSVQSSTAGKTSEIIASLRQRVDDLTRFLKVDLIGLGRVERIAQARREALDRLAMLVRRRIDAIQNPPDCATANYLIVSLNRPCAFGCNVHHLAYCFQLAYATNRTLLFSEEYSGYQRWWLTNFKNLSSRCPQLKTAEYSSAPEFLHSNFANSPRVVRCAYIGAVDSNLPWLPPVIPHDLAPELKRYHGAPFVWFIGQLIHYLMRPNPEWEKKILHLFDSYRLIRSNRTPIVGIHVRRTDKINTEAQFHHLKEYMFYVDRYYNYLESEQQMMARTQEWIGDAFAEQRLQAVKAKRRVYLATDEPKLFAEASRDYPDYEFVGDPTRAESAAVVKRTASDSVAGIAFDILALAKTDYLVCTFSSQVCRVAYELMQTRHSDLGDASGLVQSLDDIYYFGGQQAAPFETVIADSEAKLKPGDLVYMAGNHWDGYAKVTPVHSHQAVLVPAYKFQPRVMTANMGNHTGH